jgi:alkylation response protein AidB-like acyl-CoA dehydrogenase
MDFNLTSEQEQLKDSLLVFFRDRYSFGEYRAVKLSESGWRPRIWKAFAQELGILGAALPARVGGSGGSAVDIKVILEEIGSSLVVEPFHSRDDRRLIPGPEHGGS